MTTLPCLTALDFFSVNGSMMKLNPIYTRYINLSTHVSSRCLLSVIRELYTQHVLIRCRNALELLLELLWYRYSDKC
jgi:hypothetical protein